MMPPDVVGWEICDAAAKPLFLTAEGIFDYMCSLFMALEEWRCGGRDMCGDDTVKSNLRTNTDLGRRIPAEMLWQHRTTMHCSPQHKTLVLRSIKEFLVPTVPPQAKLDTHKT